MYYHNLQPKVMVDCIHYFLYILVSLMLTEKCYDVKSSFITKKTLILIYFCQDARKTYQPCKTKS